jgi:hypothetical protein
VRHDVVVVLRLDTRSRCSSSPVSGELRSSLGRREFTGWLELLGELEDVLDRTRAATAGSPAPPSGSE